MIRKIVLYSLLFIPPLLAKPGYHDPWEKPIVIQTFEESQIRGETCHKEANAYLVHLYQKAISPTTGARSHYRPSSAQYTLEAMQTRGLFLGILMGCDRLMRENSECMWYQPLYLDVNKKWYKWNPASPLWGESPRPLHQAKTNED